MNEQDIALWIENKPKDQKNLFLAKVTATGVHEKKQDLVNHSIAVIAKEYALSPRLTMAERGRFSSTLIENVKILEHIKDEKAFKNSIDIALNTWVMKQFFIK